jgi:carboxymethylenebutenolidase
MLAPLLYNFPDIVGVAIYGDANTQKDFAVHIPALYHLSGHNQSPIERTGSLTKYYYPRTKSHKFATPFQSDFHYSSESVSHTRNLQFLKPLMDGPYFDLETIWDEHTFYEFTDRSVEHTMSTMVQEPYVNHVPTVSLEVY